MMLDPAIPISEARMIEFFAQIFQQVKRGGSNKDDNKRRQLDSCVAINKLEKLVRRYGLQPRQLSGL